MAIVRMKKLTLIGLEEEKNTLLKAIQELGSVEIQDISELTQEDMPMPETEADSDQSSDIEGNDIEEKLFQVNSAIELLEKYSSEKKGMFSSRPLVNLDEFNEVLSREQELLSLANDCTKLQDRLNANRARRGNIRATIDQISPWYKLDLPFESIGRTGATSTLLCILPSNKTQDFQDWLEENDLLAHINIVSDSRDISYCLLVYHLSCESETLDKLRELEFDRLNLSGYSGTAKQLIDGYNKDLQTIDDEEEEILASIKELGETLHKLKILYDSLLIKQQKHEASHRILNTGRAYILKGWIAERDFKLLEKELTNITDAVQIQLDDPADDDVIPTTLDNPSLVQPFEVVTNLYSTPNKRDVDPNRIMAPFYFAMFGVMMGDAGYGIVMAVVGTIILKKMNLKGGAKKLVGLLAICGVSTFIWGFLSGGWFGDLGENIATSIGLDTAVVWFNPMEDPLMMLGFCFAFGLVHVLTGMGVRAYMSIRDGYVWDAVFDQGFWFILIVGLLLLLLPATAQAGKYIAIGAAVGLVLTQGRAKKNIIAKFFSGLLSLYNITGIFSDVLSYSRLFALGLSSAIIGMVFNILASMLSGAWYTIIFAVA
ncbi:MAG TPA: V-type ATP synthase subunit I, partial [Bacillota bacterium]|nr:V-type ATP synthase subunit I [Bacillota bacterium]